MWKAVFLIVYTFIVGILMLVMILLTRPANDWTHIDQIQRAIVRVEQRDGICSAWRAKPGIYLTAAHCTYDDNGIPISWVRLNGITGTILSRSAVGDLAAIFVPTQLLSGPVLQVRTDAVPNGLAVAVYGYPYGRHLLAQPTFGFVIQNDFPSKREVYGLTYEGGILMDVTAVMGMSGAPIVDRNLQVVSMVWLGGPVRDSFGVDIHAFHSFINLQ